MDNLSLREFYLTNNNGYKINIIEGSYINRPTAILINIHGIGSHFQSIINENNYDNFISRDIYFSKSNIKSYAIEFQGHGKSEGPTCLVNDFNDLINDIRILSEYLNQRYPTVKKYILAESMGGNVAIRYCVKYNDISGLILLSPMCGINKEILPNCCIRKFLIPLSYIIPNFPLATKHISDKNIRNKKYNLLKEKCKFNYNGYIKLATGRECLNASITLPHLLKKFKTPVIAFHDIDDKVTDPYITELFINNCNSISKKFVPIKDSHHCLLLSTDDNMNDPGYIMNMIKDWIKLKLI
tara:strand:+ start:5454 stop:6347 length:894 start_codon:yes stop_codon:yes gene_type:complete